MNDIYAIILEVRSLFHRLAAFADLAYRDLNVTASQRAVLESVAGPGDQNVPGIARSKRVTRQHVQTLANQLLEAGLLQPRDNPAHKRSPILELTPAGRECLDEIQKRERTLLRAMAPRFRKHDLEAAADCLRDMSTYVESLLPSEPGRL